MTSYVYPMCHFGYTATCLSTMMHIFYTQLLHYVLFVYARFPNHVAVGYISFCTHSWYLMIGTTQIPLYMS